MIKSQRLLGGWAGVAAGLGRVSVSGNPALPFRLRFLAMNKNFHNKIIYVNF